MLTADPISTVGGGFQLCLVLISETVDPTNPKSVFVRIRGCFTRSLNRAGLRV